MANTHEKVGELGLRPRRLRKSYETSGDDAEVTVSTPASDSGRIRRLVAVLVKYSSSVSKNVTVTLNAAHGAGYDAPLNTIALSAAAAGSYVPDTEVLFGPDDAIDVVAPAGGGGVTSGVTILYEDL